MVVVHKKGILFGKTDIQFENEAVLNPAAIQEGNTVHIFYRAVSLGNYSSIGYCRLNGPHTIEERHIEPILFPELASESHGIEDPRIVKIDDLYYLTYTAYDGVNALGALATSKDLKTFEKHNIITPKITYSQFEEIIKSCDNLDDHYISYFSKTVLRHNFNKSDYIWDKDLVFFPRKINGRFYFLHRIKPDIQLASFSALSDLTPEFWKDYMCHLEENTVLKPKYNYEIVHIGGGAPPIETEKGWLIIYHGVRYTKERNNIYSACAALLDLDNPIKEIARLPYPLFEPEFDWECEGMVNNVCFPCGTALFGDELTIYYGAADEQIALATVSLKELLSELTNNTNRI